MLTYLFDMNQVDEHRLTEEGGMSAVIPSNQMFANISLFSLLQYRTWRLKSMPSFKQRVNSGITIGANILILTPLNG